MDKIIVDFEMFTWRVFLDVKSLKLLGYDRACDHPMIMRLIQSKAFPFPSRELKSLDEYETKKEEEKQSLSS